MTIQTVFFFLNAYRVSFLLGELIGLSYIRQQVEATPLTATSASSPVCGTCWLLNLASSLTYQSLLFRNNRMNDRQNDLVLLVWVCAVVA